MSKPEGTLDLLATLLRQPEAAHGLTLHQWECLVWQARAAELMPQLHRALEAASTLTRAPAAAQRHLELSRVIAGRHAEAVFSELRGLQDALEPLGVPVILLKGAAYLAMGHRAAEGRIFNDIDLLVPKDALADVEQRLNWSGWFSLHTTLYDERYYRQWMHEIPPLQHKDRGTVLDVHHTILPPTSGHRPDPSALLARAKALPPPWGFFRVLAPSDMIIHSACHLFFGEFHKGLRDLHDLHRLLSDGGEEFWPKLVQRAQALDLCLPLLDALEQCQRVYRTRVPGDALAALESGSKRRWPRPARAWLFSHALRPAHRSAATRSTRLALWLTYVRSHWLRMPVPLLAYHLAHKALSPH